MKIKFGLIVFIVWFCICFRKTTQNSTEIEENFGTDNNLTIFDTESDDNSTLYSTIDPKESEETDSEEEDELEEDESKDAVVEEETTFREPQNPKEFMDYFEDLMKRTRVRLEQLFEQYMPQLIQMSSSVTLSPDCTFDAIRILFGLRKLQPWAIKSESISPILFSLFSVLQSIASKIH